jgi:asparagine synthase (glutamine-hydrolysing)
MCGIVGIVDCKEANIPVALMRTMRDVMRMRGPDGVGDFHDAHVAMAMRRLSVIDLDNGWQPLRNADGQVVAFQNGEIYNYRKLRKELESHGYLFTTNSDTEVLAHGYMAWGMGGLLARVDGMYAMAILDRRNGELHLARDRFGEKPLFYCAKDGRFAYASDLRAIAALPWVSDEVDTIGLEHYLAVHYVGGERTILRDIKRVLPGERVTVRIDRALPVRNRYYRPKLGKGPRITDETLAIQIEEAVQSRLVADVPVGIFLSGGLDSSIIAALAARQVPKIATFSMGFASADHDESRYARLIAERIGSTHYHFFFDDTSFSDLLPRVAAALDEPVGDQALLPVYWLCKEARKVVTVALSGEGADEIFAGYNYYGRFARGGGIGEFLKRFFLGRATEVYDRFIHNREPVTPSGFPLLTDIANRLDLMGTLRDGLMEWEQDLIEWLRDASDPLQRATGADIATWLPDDLLVKFDRMAMTNSLEGRAPYLQLDLVDMAVRGLSSEDRMADGTSKVALRRLASRWLPEAICSRPKQGFVLPMGEWLAQWLESNGGPQQYFLKRGVPGLNMKRIADMAIHELRVGIVKERLLFALVLLCEWYAAFSSKIGELRQAYEGTIAAGNLSEGSPPQR